jgi:protoheme IX farnesyltransferase
MSIMQAAIDRPTARMRSQIDDYFQLLKPRITFLVLVTTVAGCVLAAGGPLPWLLVLHTLIGTALASGGASALNQYMERDVDGLMRRTQDRPLPQGRLTPTAVLIYGLCVSLAGVVYLAATVNLLTAGVAAFTIASYLLIYTPSKRVTWLSTLIGAVPGAMPPVIGWAALRNDLGLEAWVLFAIVFLWQIPHFLAIAWMYRNDYARAGFPVLPVQDPGGERTSRHITWNCVALLFVSLVPTLLGLTGRVYFVGALIIGLAFLAFGVATSVLRTNLSARRLLVASVIYHPILLALIVFDTVKHVF